MSFDTDLSSLNIEVATWKARVYDLFHISNVIVVRVYKGKITGGLLKLFFKLFGRFVDISKHVKWYINFY